MSGLLGGVLFFLVASLVLYVLLGGADFGAGILEFFLNSKRSQEQRKLISEAMAPVWEANHVWLILALVILFMGFPQVYTTMAVHLYIPLMALLVGIVGRGCAFTFRHYDTYDSDYYLTFSRIFAVSSLWAAFFLGVTAGSVMLGAIDPQALDFHAAYIAPWCNGFCFSVGLFTAGLFSFLAAVYLVGEATTRDLRAAFLRKARNALVLTVLMGGLVFASAEIHGFSLARLFWHSPGSIFCMVAATLLLVPFWKSLSTQGKNVRARILGAAMISFVVLGWAAAQLPMFIRYPNGRGLTLLEAQAPEASLRALLIALVAGSVLIFPAFGYLFRVFKERTF